MRALSRLSPLALALLLGGCAVMDADDCARADWRQLGRQDASAGYGLDRFKQRAKACREHGREADARAYEAGHREGQRVYCSVSRGQGDAVAGKVPASLCLAPPQADYERGFASGLQTFCRARNAYEHGRAGGADPQTCPELSRLDFETGHRLGRDVHELETKRQRLLSDASAQRGRAADEKRPSEEREKARRSAAELEAEAERVRLQQRRLEVQALSLPR